MRYPLVLSALAAIVLGGTQEVDINRLMADIRTAVAAQIPDFAFYRGGEYGPGSSGNFFLTWSGQDTDRLHLSCNQYRSAEEAITHLRQLRMMISGGVPEPLPGVADEAYYLGAYGWHTYFARGQFVCQAGGPAEAPTRNLTDIVVKHLGSRVRSKQKLPFQAVAREDGLPAVARSGWQASAVACQP